MRASRLLLIAFTAAITVSLAAAPQPPAAATAQAAPPSTSSGQVNPKLDQYKRDVGLEVDAMQENIQKWNDTVFSFAEPGFQEFETSKYLTGILKQNGFLIQENLAGIPTAWTATWGTGKPVIALGSDIDDIPQASQKPGVAWHEPIIEGAPGHGEGHNSGMPLQIAAALAVKKIMEQQHLQGTLKLWPGVAEELLGTKAYYVRAGAFKDVDICIFAHVGANMQVSWGDSGGNGMVSVEYTFKGESAHAAGAPWRGRSALDAVELMDIGWNFRREHLRLQQRSHYVIPNGGDQPNVVPPNASVWYYFRETSYDEIKKLWDIGNTMAKAAAMMTDTEYTMRVLGSAWPGHFNKTVAETMYANIERVGLPQWSEADIALAKALQHELKVPEVGLATKLNPLRGREVIPDDEKRGGGSDDIGDISWNVPTVTLNYPSNMQAGPGHNWANAISMATPIAHKGIQYGAKVMALTILDLLTRPELVAQAWDYFNNVQTKNKKYVPLIRPEDQPAIWLNKERMEKYRPEMKKYYYDPTKYKTYLEQLGIKYPTTVKPATKPSAQQ
ncbi:MAG: amidohydrolase [Acidobacteria bacterium]|nr:MAG: amidohydrolase [Acidobacteriota bacterium]PYR19172.1 MAG: amidohydrolase [Acidobacteriota bacterium]